MKKWEGKTRNPSEESMAKDLARPSYLKPEYETCGFARSGRFPFHPGKMPENKGAGGLTSLFSFECTSQATSKAGPGFSLLLPKAVPGAERGGSEFLSVRPPRALGPERVCPAPLAPYY